MRNYTFAVGGRNTSGAGEWTRATAWKATPEQIASVTATARDDDGITLSMTVAPANGGYHITRIHVNCRTSSDGGTTWSGWFAGTPAEAQGGPVSGSTFTTEMDSTNNYDPSFTYQARARNGLGASWDWRESPVIPSITLTARSIDTATLTLTGIPAAGGSSALPPAATPPATA